MSVTRDILATYRHPYQVAVRRQADGPREDRALAVLMAALIVIFVAQWPRLSREAHLTESDIMPLMGGALMGWVFMMPLVFYALAFITQIILKAFGGTTGYQARMALFWALLAATPIVLFQGLIAGFIGPGALNTTAGLVWFVSFMVFWLAGLRAARQKAV